MGKRGKDKVRLNTMEATQMVVSELMAGMNNATHVLVERARAIAPIGSPPKDKNPGVLARDLTAIVDRDGNNVHGWVGIKKGSPAEPYALRRMETGFYGRDSLGRFVHKDPRPHLLSKAAGQVSVKIMRSMMLGKKYIRSGK